MASVEPVNETNNADKKKSAVEITNDIPLKQQIWDLFREWLGASSCIGVPFMERASCHVIRIVWLVFFLTAIASTGYFIITTLTAYFQYGVLNQLSLAKQYPTYFPAVAICNTNPFNGNRSRAYIDAMLTANNLSDFINIADIDVLEAKYDNENTINILDTLLENLRWWTASDTSLTEASRRALGFEFNPDMLITCSFNNKKCSASDFSYFRSYKYGNCYVFNGGTNANNSKVDLLKTSKIGNKNGLQLELLVGDPNDEVRFVYKSGVYVAIFNQTLSTLQLTDNGMYLPTGFDSYIGINRQFYTKLPAPYSTCIEDFTAPVNAYAKKLYGYMKDLGVSVYTQDFCSSICYQDQLIDKCGCADAAIPTLRGAKFCNSPFFACMTDFENVFNEVDIEKQCQSACPVKCSTVGYDLQLSQSTYPTQYYINILKTKQDFTDNLDILAPTGVDFIDQSLVKVVINYNDLQYTQITEIPVTTPDALIGTLGGQLGAFLGITFLSLIEILDLVMNIIRLVYLHHRAKKEQELNKNKASMF